MQIYCTGVTAVLCALASIPAAIAFHIGYTPLGKACTAADADRIISYVIVRYITDSLKTIFLIRPKCKLISYRPSPFAHLLYSTCTRTGFPHDRREVSIFDGRGTGSYASPGVGARQCGSQPKEGNRRDGYRHYS